MNSASSLLDKLLDASVYYSFDESGFHRHSSSFQALPTDLSGRHYVITGANSGIGFALAHSLVTRGAQLTLICRHRGRGELACARLSKVGQAEPRLLIADLTDLSALDEVTSQIDAPIDALVHNAGFLPTSLSLSSQGYEMTVSAHLIGPMRLTARLKGQLEARTRESVSRSQVIFVSSGGMYTQRLRVAPLKSPPPSTGYDGVLAYAQTKRAQVELAAMMHHRWRSSVSVHSMHPGWVATPGLERSLPRFYRWTQGRLRTAEQGADTLTWLCASDASTSFGDEPHFWFDRRARSPYLLGKRPARAQLDALWAFTCEAAGLPLDWLDVIS
jgi:dehydrogenase/reductase SDR family member 12